jgi:hypothetical protein
MTEQNEFI